MKGYGLDIDTSRPKYPQHLSNFICCARYRKKISLTPYRKAPPAPTSAQIDLRFRDLVESKGPYQMAYCQRLPVKMLDRRGDFVSVTADGASAARESYYSL